MKKFLMLVICALAINYAHAQKLNQDTLAKYSKKSEQDKIFNQIAFDIHLDAAQTAKFDEISGMCCNKAIAVAKDTKTARRDKLGRLKQLLDDYLSQIKQVLSPEQFAKLKKEREKYHFGKRFIW